MFASIYNTSNVGRVEPDNRVATGIQPGQRGNLAAASYPNLPQAKHLMLIGVKMATHSFHTDDAEKYGIEEAILLQNIGYWCGRNLANRQNIKNGRVWTYNTRDAFLEQFPYIAKGKDQKAKRMKIGRILQSLENQGAIVSEQLNKSNYDRTKWYSLADMDSLGKYSEYSPEALKSLKEQNCSIGKTDVFHQENRSVPSSLSNINTDVGSSSKPAPAGFDYELVLFWVMNELRKAGYDVNGLLESFIKASFEEYVEGAEKPAKSRALAWIETALKQKQSSERRSMKNGQARDEVSEATVKVLKAQAKSKTKKATQIQQETGPGKTLEDKLNDRSWDDDSNLLS